MFIGEYIHNQDAKKRLAVPAKFRSELGKRAVLARGPDKCLALYPLKEWEKVANKIAELPTGDRQFRSFARFFLSGASEVELDGLGRILIPDFLKEHAGLHKKVVIAGVNDRIEIWDDQKWKEYKNKTESAGGEIAERLKELGI